MLRGPGYRRVAPDVWLAAGTATDLRVRAETLAAWSRDTGVVAGPLAARIWRADCPWDDAEVVMRTPRRLPPPGTRVRTDRLRHDEIAARWGVAVTSPVRTAFDLARRAPLVEAVAAVDALAFRCRFTAERLRAMADRHPRARGAVQVRSVLDLMDPRAESLPETRLRLLFVLRGLPRPIPQYPVRLRTSARRPGPTRRLPALRPARRADPSQDHVIIEQSAWSTAPSCRRECSLITGRAPGPGPRRSFRVD